MSEKSIGLSVRFDYLTGSDQHAFHRLFGPADKALNTFKQHDVTSIEMRAVSPNASPEKVMAATRNILDAGLDFTIHGLLPSQPADSFRNHYPSMTRFLDWLRDQHHQALTLTVHAYAHREGDKPQLIAQTVHMLRLLAEECDRECWPVRFALELNRSKAIVDPSVDYDTLVAMSEQVDHPRMGLCWDWGHGYSNHQRGLLAKDPPAAFLNRVIHTHIHDLNVEGKTHWPLTEGIVPVVDYVSLLRQSGYQGVWNLELSPHLFELEPAAAERMLQSIDLLSSAIASNDS